MRLEQRKVIANIDALPNASDTVDPNPIVPCTPLPNTLFPLGETTVNCTAKDAAGNTSPASTFKITVKDTTAPVLNIPAAQPVSLSSPVVADVVDSRPAVTNNALVSFGSGTTTVTWTAADQSGNKAACAQRVTAQYSFDGFYQPVDMNAVNMVKGGVTVPVKWNLLECNGVKVTTVSAVAAGWPKTTQISCKTLSTLSEDVIEETTTSNTTLRYDLAAMQFVYNWKMPKNAGTCYRLDVKFIDGSTYSANFKTK